MSGIFNMTNLNANVKSKGVVLFAFNTDKVNYIEIAERASRLITRNLNLPVTIITDIGEMPKNFRKGYAGGTLWYNSGRYLAYELSPYDETLLLDSDYLILDDSLLKILDSAIDYTIMTKNQNPTQSMTGNMGMLSLNYVWATAIAFKIPTNASVAFEIGTVLTVLNIGVGTCTISAVTPGTTTVLSAGATPAAPTLGQYKSAACLKTGTDSWFIVGGIS